MALPQFGTMTTFDTLQSTQQTIAQYGEDKVWDGIASLVDAYNAQVQEITGDLVVRTTSRLRRYGGATALEMQRMGEFDTPNTQKTRAGAPIGFPLENYGIALQWTLTYLKTRKVSEFAAQIQAAVAGDMRRLIRNIKIALMTGINYNFTDYLVDHLEVIPLPVKALANGDGQPIPVGPNGESWDGHTHTHYLASSTITNAWLRGLVETVIEHYNEGQAVLIINRADQSGVEALADYKPLVDSRIVKSANQEYGQGDLDKNKLYNRMIGYFRGAEVWVKPWAVPSYYLVYMQGVPQPLVMRVRGENADGGAAIDGAGDLTLVFEDESHPLRARGWEREYGLGVWNRTAAAIGYVGGTAYLQPVIT